LKILTLVYNLKKGGTQRAAQNFCEAYADLGHDSRMLAAYEGGLRAKELINRGINVWVNFVEKILKEIVYWNPDVIHIHSHGIKKETVFQIQRALPHAKYIETNVFSFPSDYVNILNYSYQLSDWCQYLYFSRGGRRDTSVIVPYPVKTKNFNKATKKEINIFKKKYRIPQEAFVFGRIGQHFYGKWSLYLIKLFTKFIKNVSDKACLLIVNPPKEIIEYINDIKLKKNIIIIEKITNDNELKQCYSSIDLFLHIASQGESFGMVLAESLLCETPVIALQTPWGDNSQCEVIGNGGICVNTIDDFYSKIVKLYSNKNFRNKLAKDGREHIINKYDYLLIAQKSINIIENNNCKKYIGITSPKTYQICFYKNKVVSLLLWIKFNVKHSHKYINYLLKRLLKYNY